MRIFNKCLKKQINTDFILNNLNITSSNLNKLSLISKTFARNIGRPTLQDNEVTGEKTFKNKIENADFQAPPKIKIENSPNDFENSSASNNFEGDRAFNKDREFKQKKGGNYQNENEFGENQNPRGNRREMFGERDSRGFKGDREFKNKRFDENSTDNFREKRNFDREPNFERKDRNFKRDDTEFGGEKKFERRRFDGDRSEKFRNNREENSENPSEKPFERPIRRFDNKEGGERNFRNKRFDNEENDSFQKNRSFEKRDFKGKFEDREFKPRRFDNDNRGEGEFKPRRFDNSNRGEGEFKPRRFDNDNRGEGEFKPRRFNNDRFGEGEFKPRRFDNDNRGEGEFKPRRFNNDRFGDKPRSPRRFGDEENQGFDNRRERSFDKRSDKFGRFDKFNNNYENQGFKGERRFDQSTNENGQKFNKRQDQDLPNNEEEEFEKLMGEIKAEDAKVFVGQENLEGESKVNVKLPKKSFKDNKTEKTQEFDNPEITKIDDAEKYINENKPKKRLRFGEEKKIDSVKQTLDTAKEESVKVQENINEEELNEIETGEPKDQEAAKNGVVYEYRENKKKYEYIYGSHAVESALSYNYRKNLDLFVSMNYKDNTPDLIQKLINLAKTKNVSIKYLVKDKLEKFTQKRPTNGVVLKSEPREYVSIKSFDFFSSNFIKKPKGNLIILLDQIVDPQNFGSIIRSAFFIGADFVLVNRIRKPPISSAVSKVSSGASECMDLFSVRNIKHFLSDANKRNWTILNTAIEKEDDIAKTDSLDLEEFDNNENTPLTTSENKPVQNKTISLDQLNVNPEENVILILGSEGFGVSSDVMKSFVNYNIYIPPQLDKSKVNQHPFDMIDSLNVGVSAGIIINHVCSQMKSNIINDTEAKSSLEENGNEIKSENNHINQIQNEEETKRTANREDIKI